MRRHERSWNSLQTRDLYGFFSEVIFLPLSQTKIVDEKRWGKNHLWKWWQARFLIAVNFFFRILCFSVCPRGSCIISFYTAYLFIYSFISHKLFDNFVVPLEFFLISFFAACIFSEWQSCKNPSIFVNISSRLHTLLSSETVSFLLPFPLFLLFLC